MTDTPKPPPTLRIEPEAARAHLARFLDLSGDGAEKSDALDRILTSIAMSSAASRSGRPQ